MPREAEERSNDYMNLSSITSRLHKRRRAFPTGLNSMPMGSSAPLPCTTLLPAAHPGAATEGSSLLSPPARTKLLFGASWHGTEQCLHPLGSNLQPALPRTACEGSPLHGGCCHQHYSSAYIFIFFNCCVQHSKSPA